jgi:hypothetical protein
MNTVLEMISIAVLAVLYGLAWHNQPAREPVLAPRIDRKPESHE